MPSSPRRACWRPPESWRALETPHTAAGPALRELILGSEGALGVIPEVTVRCGRRRRCAATRGWMAESFAAGAEIVRGLPDVVRLSDEEGAARRRARAALRRRRLPRLGPPGAPGSTAATRGRTCANTLMEMGAMVETLETAHTWSHLGELHRTGRRGNPLRAGKQGTPGLVFCHLSRAYADGASLYFTFIARARREAALDQWRAVKRTVCEAIVAHGGTITHHHGVGRDHSPYMEAEVGKVGVEALRALKARLDPAGVMNPGRLLPDG